MIDDALIVATQAVAVWAAQGLEAAMNRFNGPAEQSPDTVPNRPADRSDGLESTDHAPPTRLIRGGTRLARQHL